MATPIIAFSKDWHEDPTSNHHVLRELAIVHADQPVHDAPAESAVLPFDDDSFDGADK